MNRKPIIIGNWKMNKTVEETQQFINEVDSKLIDKKIDCGVAVNFISLDAAIKQAKNLIILAQNCFYEDNGAFTGEISPVMLRAININYCIIGHSERRTIFSESDEVINKKLKKLLDHKIVPVLCCGETLEQYQNRKTQAVISNQIISAFKDVNAEDAAKVIIAYEPIWAIGTGETASVKIAQEVCNFIRNEILKLYDANVANNIRIQYGGSVKPDNIKHFLAEKDIDGALVGGASLDVKSFLTLINN